MEGILRSVYDGGLIEQQVLDYGVVRDVVAGETGGNWEQVDSKWGTRWYADEQPLDTFWLSQSDFPADYNAFRVTYFVPDNPDYPRKYASSEWFDSSQWPPDLDLLEGVDATGIAHIVFRRSQ